MRLFSYFSAMADSTKPIASDQFAAAFYSRPISNWTIFLPTGLMRAVLALGCSYDSPRFLVLSDGAGVREAVRILAELSYGPVQCSGVQPPYITQAWGLQSDTVTRH